MAEDDAFCKKADIDSMMLFIGEPLEPPCFGRSITRPGYLLVTDNVYNGSLKMTYSKGWAGPYIGTYTVDILTAFDDDECLWPEKLTMTVNMLNGSMIIKDKDCKVWAKLTKNNEMSVMCSELKKLD
jgi:hypothetical protein